MVRSIRRTINRSEYNIKRENNGIVYDNVD
jgi:hypothetical protein